MSILVDLQFKVFVLWRILFHWISILRIPILEDSIFADFHFMLFSCHGISILVYSYFKNLYFEAFLLFCVNGSLF